MLEWGSVDYAAKAANRVINGGGYGAGIRMAGLNLDFHNERVPIPSKMERDFVLKVGLLESEWGREIIVRARSSLEAGLLILQNNLIEPGYVAHSLVDPLDIPCDKVIARKARPLPSPRQAGRA